MTAEQKSLEMLQLEVKKERWLRKKKNARKKTEYTGKAKLSTKTGERKRQGKRYKIREGQKKEIEKKKRKVMKQRKRVKKKKRKEMGKAGKRKLNSS